MNRYKKTFYASLITLGCILFTFGFLCIIRTSSFISEGWSRSISRGIQYVTTFLFRWLPISAFELFIICLVIYIVIWLILAIRHLHRFKFRGSSKYWLNFGIVISLILTVYMGTAGMEYNRYKVDIPQHTELVENTLVYKEIGEYFQSDYNEISKHLSYDEKGMLIMPYTHDEMNTIMSEEFKSLKSDYYTTNTPKTKLMYIFGWLYRELQITGVAFAPTGEPNMNPLVTPGEYAFTMAHEIAHTKGIIKEEDANLVAAYICLTSTNEYLRYSGYVYTIYSLAYLVACTNVKEYYTSFQNGFTKECVNDSIARSNYWREHNMLAKISDFINNIYLILQGDHGTISYEDNIHVEEEEGKYYVNSYSRYQALYLWIYFDLLGK